VGSFIPARSPSRVAEPMNGMLVCLVALRLQARV
jgi:hypothetical protein